MSMYLSFNHYNIIQSIKLKVPGITRACPKNGRLQLFYY
jgi:hypothetical protein